MHGFCRSSAITRWAGAILGLGLFVGCAHEGGAPSAPESSESPSVSSELRDFGWGTVASGKRGSDRLPAPTPITVRQRIKGADGGEVVNGRYRLWFAPGAFTGTETITITDPGTADGQCVLGPEGLHFSALVTLTIDVNGTVFDSPVVTIEWWDPTAASWVDMYGLYSAYSHNVYIVLPHFSTYRPRAGW